MSNDVPQEDLVILQGTTFRKAFNWFAGAQQRRGIEGITPGFPTIITITGHGLVIGAVTPITLFDIKGIPQLNTQDCEAVEATYVTDDTFSVPINTIGREWVDPSGAATWFEPSDITGFTAKMQIRPSKSSEEIIHELTDGGGGITMDINSAAFLLEIENADTELFDFRTAVYDLEITGPTPDFHVTRLVEGDVRLDTEVTR